MATRRAVLAVTAGVGSALAAACGGQQAGGSEGGGAKALRAVTVRWAADWEATFQPTIDPMMAKFRQQVPQVTVSQEFTPGAEYYTKLQTSLAAGAMPDVSLMTTRWSAQWIRGTRGAYQPLDAMIKRDKVDVADYWPLEMPGFSDEQSRVHILPYDISVNLLFYNRALLQQEGIAFPTAQTTLDDMLAAARRLTKAGPDGRVSTFGYDGFQTGGQFEFVIERFGGALFDEKLTKCLMNSAGSVQAVQWWMELRHKHHVAPLPAELTDLGGSEKAFGNGRVAMAIMGTPSVARIRMYTLDWDVAPIPRGPKGDQLRSGGGGYGIAGKTDKADESWALLKFLTSKETLAEMIGKSGRSIPGRKSVAEASTDATKPPKNWPVAFKEAEKAKAISFSLYPRGGDVLDEVGKGLGPIFNAGGDVKGQLDQMTAKIDAILASR